MARPQWMGLLVVAVLLADGCRAPAESDRPAERRSAAVAMVRTELFFGLGRGGAAGGGEVSEERWQAFVRDEITPRFPDGLTILSAAGQWRDHNGLDPIREPSRIVLILHEPGVTADRRIEEIRAAYRKQFGQTSVLRADSPAKVSF